MDAAERDVTDLGLINDISVAELRELREARARDERRELGPVLPTPRAAMEALGWKPRGEALARACPRCEAPAMSWCRAGKRVIVGKLCEVRENL